MDLIVSLDGLPNHWLGMLPSKPKDRPPNRQPLASMNFGWQQAEMQSLEALI